MQKREKLTLKQTRELQDFIGNPKSSGREVRRAQAVLMLNEGTAVKTIISQTRYSRRQIFDLRKNYLNKGISAIKDRKKGKPKEILTKNQLSEIVKTVKEKTPKDYGYDYDFWTTGILGNLIESEYKTRYKSKTSIYLIFKQAKFSYHKPDRLYQARNEQEVQSSENEAEIKVKQALSEKETIVLVADEMSLSTQTTVQRIWLPQGEYPQVKVASKREARSIYGFLNIRNGKETAFKTKWQNMYITREVLKELRKVYPDQKIFLIWDKAPWHKGSIAQQFIKEDDNIETFDFPRAAPEQNPQEHVWKNGRSHVSHNAFIQDIDKATDDFVAYLNATRFPYSLIGFSAGL